MGQLEALGETVVAVQWGPWREVGMAATKGTASRNFLGDGVKIESDRIVPWCVCVRVLSILNTIDYILRYRYCLQLSTIIVMKGCNEQL